MITLTILAIVFAAILAHVAGHAPTAAERPARWLDSHLVVAGVFATTFAVLWYTWAAWTPPPVVHDEMAYVFQAQLLARGRWALPSPPFPAFWEQPHILIEPAVTSKYFPGHSLALVPGALLGWMPLMPLVLQSGIASLLYVLARRISNGVVALLAWVIWLSTPMVLFFGPTYFSESTTTVCWMLGWYALLEWRATRWPAWLMAVAFFTGWDAITRPLTGVAYAIPIGIVVLRDVIRGRRWRDLSLAMLVGVVVIGILPIWSACTTGDWRMTPLALYTRMYMPYDVPGFGLITTAPGHTLTPDMVQWNGIYSAFHVSHLVNRLPSILRLRAIFLFISTFGTTSGMLGVFAVLGMVTLTAESAFAVGSSVLLVLAYLVYATPPQWTLYYFETTPAFAYLAAAGLAWALSLFGRPRRTPPSDGFTWRSRRWTTALVTCALLLLLPGIGAVRIVRAEHVRDGLPLARFRALLASIHDPKAIVFVRYAGDHNPHDAFVRNSANPSAEQVWTVYDRGETENARLLATVPERKAYLFDERSGHTYDYTLGARR